MHKVLDVMRQAAEEARLAILDKKREGISNKEKSYRDFVTNCDIASERAIISVLRKEYPESAFHSEEAGSIPGKGWLWIIDPIDGTHNFMRGLPYYAVSIAAAWDGEIVAALISLPETNAHFSAYKGSGAYMNGQKIAVSDTENLGDAIIAYDNQFHNDPAMAQNLPKLINECFSIRILGSACVDLCKVSEGALDARILHKPKLVDFAAGSLIVEEAGGKVTDFSGKPYDLNTTCIVASNGRSHDRLLEILVV